MHFCVISEFTLSAERCYQLSSSLGDLLTGGKASEKSKNLLQRVGKKKKRDQHAAAPSDGKKQIFRTRPHPIILHQYVPAVYHIKDGYAWTQDGRAEV